MSDSDDRQHTHGGSSEQMQDQQQMQQDGWNDPAAVGGQPQRPSMFQMALFWIVHILMFAAVIAPVIVFVMIGFKAGLITGVSGLLLMRLFRFILVR